MKTAAFSAAGLIVLLAASSARAGLFDDDEARRQIAQQKQQLDKLVSQNQALEGRLGKLEEALKDAQANSQGALELLGQIEALTQEVRQLRGRIEEQGHTIEATAKRQKDFYVDLDGRLRRLEQAAAAPPAPPAAVPPATPAVPPAGPDTPPASSTPSPASPTPPASSAPSPDAAAKSRTNGGPRLPPTPRWKGAAPGDEIRSYETAYELFKSGNYQGAIGGFGSFLKTYPKSPLAPSAQYWIGNSHYKNRDYTSAIASQQKLLAAYPESQKAPDALLNIATSQTEMGDRAAARKTLEELVTKYPASEAAEKAKSRLTSLK